MTLKRQYMVVSHGTPELGFNHSTLQPVHFSHVAAELNLFRAQLSANIVCCAFFFILFFYFASERLGPLYRELS